MDKTIQSFTENFEKEKGRLLFGFVGLDGKNEQNKRNRMILHRKNGETLGAEAFFVLLGVLLSNVFCCAGRSCVVD